MNINIPYIPLDCPVCGRELIRFNSRTVTPSWLNLSCPETIPDPIHNEKNEFQLTIDIETGDILSMHYRLQPYLFEQYQSDCSFVFQRILDPTLGLGYYCTVPYRNQEVDPFVSLSSWTPDYVRNKINFLITFS